MAAYINWNENLHYFITTALKLDVNKIPSLVLSTKNNGIIIQYVFGQIL